MLYAGTFYSRSRQERGVLTLEKNPDWVKNSRNTQYVANDSVYTNIPKPLLLCTYYEAFYKLKRKFDPTLTTVWVHPMLVGTVQDILKSTGSLPLAMQTL